MMNSSKTEHMKTNWTTNKFKYELSTSKGLSITKADLVDEGVPVISYGQIHSKYGGSVNSFDDLPFVPEVYLSQKHLLLQKGDFIFADTSEDIEGSGNFSTKFDEGQLFAGYHTIVARLKKQSSLEFRYLKHLFDSEWFRDQVRKSVSGVKVYSITQSIIGNTSVIVPPIEEQQAIAEFLDEKVAKLEEAKRLLNQQIEKLQAYRKSVIYQAVTKGLDSNVEMKDSGVEWIGEVPKDWEVGKVSYFYSVILGKMLSPTAKGGRNYVEYFKAKNVQDNGLDTTSVDEMYASDSELKTYSLKKGDLLVTEGGDVARSVILKKDYPNTIIQNSLHKVKGRNGNENWWLYYLLQILKFSGYIDLLVNKATIAHFTKEKLETLVIAVPSNLSEQKFISDFLNEKTNTIDRIVQNKQNQIEVLDKQKKTLIYDYVTGKRRV